MKALNQYTFAGAVSALFLAIASYYLKSATIGATALSFITLGVFSSALVLFLAAQLTYNYFFPETAVPSTSSKPTPDTSNTPTPVPKNTLTEEAQSVIRINMNKICQTSGWYNNCGLNCMTHFMFTKLSAIPSRQFARFIKGNPEYDSFLSTFQTYYRLKQKPNWQGILTLLANHTRSDREAIFAPVLRLHMGKVLPKFTDVLWDTKFATAISEFINSPKGTVTDVAEAVYHSNKAFFKNHKQQYDDALEQILAVKMTVKERKNAAQKIQTNIDSKEPENKQTFINQSVTDETIQEQVFFTRKRKLEDKMLPKAKAHWISQGCKAYADYVADLETAEMISADQLMWLSERFNIGVEIYTPASMKRAIADPKLGERNHGMQSKPEGQFKWTMRVHNRGVHWTFEEANESQAATAEHNSRFYSEGDKSSQYKKLGSPKSIATIKKAIQGLMNVPKLLIQNFAKSAKSKETPPSVVAAKVTVKRRTATH